MRAEILSLRIRKKLDHILGSEKYLNFSYNPHVRTTSKKRPYYTWDLNATKFVSKWQLKKDNKTCKKV